MLNDFQKVIKEVQQLQLMVGGSSWLNLVRQFWKIMKIRATQLTYWSRNKNTSRVSA